jgi:hypothetical protein
VVVVLGLFAGVLISGMTFPLYAGFYNATPFGVLTLPRLTGLSYGAVVAAITFMAFAAFAIIDRFARQR